MLQSKIILRGNRQMDRQRFYQDIRNSSRDATKRGNQSQRQTNRDGENVSGRKTTRFDKDASFLGINSAESTKLSSEIDRSSRGKHSSSQTAIPLEGPAGNHTSRAGTGNVGAGGEYPQDTARPSRRDKSHEGQGDKSSLADGDLSRSLKIMDMETTNRVLTENKLLKIEMDDVHNQLEMLKNDQECNLQKISDARKEKEQMEREHQNEIKDLMEKLHSLQSSHAECINMIENQKRKREMFEEENERLKAELETKGLLDDQKMMRASEKFLEDNEKLKAELEKKSKLLEKMMDENAILMQNGYTSEKDLQEKLDRLKEKVERKKNKLIAAQKEMQMLKKNSLTHDQELELKNQIEKLAEALRAKDTSLNDAKKERRDAILERGHLEQKCNELKEQFIDLHSQIHNLQKVNEGLKENNKKLDRDLELANKENEKLKEENKEEKENALKLLKFTTLEEKVSPLKEAIREKDAKIKSLEKEIDTLQHAIHGYQKDIDRLRTDPNHRVASRAQETPDHAQAHRRLRDENTRLMSMVNQYRQSAPSPPPQPSNDDLEDAKKQLKSSNDRVAQLEKWLDEIYNDKNFDIVMKGHHQGRGQKSPSSNSLPELLPNKRQYVLVKGPSDIVDRRLRSGFFTDRTQQQ